MNEDRKIDEAFLAEMMKRGEKAWKDVPDATAWVEELRTDMTQNKMNDTPTPRTDALMPDQGHKRTIYEHIQVMETHARKLERELAEAKHELAKYTNDSGDDSLFNVRRLRSELAETTKQRDECERQFQEKTNELITSMNETDIARKQRDALAAALKRIMNLTTPDQNMPYCKHDRIYGIAEGILTATEGEKP
jgi:hypothetical protein